MIRSKIMIEFDAKSFNLIDYFVAIGNCRFCFDRIYRMHVKIVRLIKIGEECHLVHDPWQIKGFN